MSNPTPGTYYKDGQTKVAKYADFVRRLADKYFGPIPARPVPERVRLDEPPHHAPARLEMKHARVAQPSWRRLYLAPSYRADMVAIDPDSLQVHATWVAGERSEACANQV